MVIHTEAIQKNFLFKCVFGYFVGLELKGQITVSFPIKVSHYPSGYRTKSIEMKHACLSENQLLLSKSYAIIN